MVDRERRIAALDSRIGIVDDFVEARKYEKSDARKMADMCTELLKKRDVDSAIRVGDAFALLVEYHFRVGNAHDAFEYKLQVFSEVESRETGSCSRCANDASSSTLTSSTTSSRSLSQSPFEWQGCTENRIHAAVGAAMPPDDSAPSDEIPEDAAQVDDDDDLIDDRESGSDEENTHK